MNTQDLIIVDVFCKEYHIETNFIIELEEFGLIETINQNETKYIEINQIGFIEKLIRMHNDLQINKEGIEVVLHLLEKVNQLQSDVNTLKNRLNLYE